MDPAQAKILLVDDDTDLREALTLGFRRRKYQVVDAANGRDALEIVRNQKVHIVLSDIRMPGGDGMELLQELRQIDPKIPVLIFMTGFADITQSQAIAAGAHKIFAKPFDQKALHAEVEAILADWEKNYQSPSTN